MVYEFTDYKRFLNSSIASMPKKGRGQARKLADHLGVHSVVISQILSGSRDFTHEQALEVASYFALDERASEYFVTLVLKARAGTKKLEQHLEKKLSAIRDEALKLKNLVPRAAQLSDEDTAIFYSNWFYGGVHLAIACGFSSAEELSERLGLDRTRVARILDYLVSRGLARVNDRGRYSLGLTSTFLEADSPFINGHHRNWRMKAMDSLTKRKANDFYYSGPCAISAKDKDAFRAELVKLVASFSKRVQESNREQMSCLNIDWFDF